MNKEIKKPVFCTDCIYYRDRKGNTAKCVRYSLIDMVDGGHSYLLEASAWYQREGGWLYSRINNLCGKEGRFFKAKDDKTHE